MTWKCRVGLHAWSKWTTPVDESWTGQVYSYGVPVGDQVTYAVSAQNRACAECGFSQRREVPKNG